MILTSQRHCSYGVYAYEYHVVILADFESVSVYFLMRECILILSGAVADLVGPRNMCPIGTFPQSIFTLACGFSRTSVQMGVLGLLQVSLGHSACSPLLAWSPHVSLMGRHRNLFYAIAGGYF